MRADRNMGAHVAAAKPKAPTPKAEAPVKKVKAKVKPELSPEQNKKKKRIKRIIYTGCTAVAAIAVIVFATMLKNTVELERYDEYFRQGSEFYYAGNYEQALSYLRKAETVSRTDECVLLMVECYEQQGMHDKALELLRSLDVSNADIMAKIAAIEAQRDALAQQDKVLINGQSYDLMLSELALKEKGLDDSVLVQITQLYSLQSLNLAGNIIKDISPLSQLGGLTVLDLSENLIEDITPLASLKGLRILYLDSNPISDLSPLCELSGLTMLSIKNIEISETELQELSVALPGCAIHCEGAIEDVAELSLGGVSFKSNVTELNLSGKGIDDISILSRCKQLKRLDISGNIIADLKPLMDIPGLQWLNIKDNNITDLRPLMGLTSLRYINAEGNGVSSTAPLGTLTNVRELHLAFNPLTDTSGLGKLKNLETLGLENTGLTNEMLSELVTLEALRTLNIYDNPELTGEGVDALEIQLHLCTVFHSKLAYMIEIGGEKYRQDVTELDLASKAIEDISPLGSFNKLEKLVLHGNKIKNIYVLEWIKTLKHVDLANNEIEDISVFITMNQLETLDLSGNKIKNVRPLMALTALKELHIGGNGLTQVQIDELKAALPNCNILT